jgi:hypothetical protein
MIHHGSVPVDRSARPNAQVRLGCVVAVAGLLAAATPGFLAIASADILTNIPALTNLTALSSRLPIGRTGFNVADYGPKAIVTADFDGDGRPDLAVSNTDGSVSVFFGTGQGRFAAPRHLLTVAGASLRGLVAADLNGDGRPDLAVAAPFQSRLFLFHFAMVGGVKDFSAAQSVPTWPGARNVEAGDFDGDGITDLAVAGPDNGLRQYRGQSDGSFLAVTNVSALSFHFLEPSKFPKPVYSLKHFRPPGSNRDWLAATHAETNLVWLLAPNADGLLEIRTEVTGNAEAHGLVLAPIFRPAASDVPDLVTVLRDRGMIEVHRGTNTATGISFLTNADSRLRKEVPGGPRAVSVVDLNDDGWNDLVVVRRNLDSILTYTNYAGRDLLPVSERPVGTSPRELVTADFNGDGHPDVAVMNRGSADLTVLLASDRSAGYRAVDNIYLVDGQVAALTVTNFNGDCCDDVIQLHQASGDFSVRLANRDGTLQPPIYYTVGNVPATQVLVDVNNDDVTDVVTANLGMGRIERGSVTVRLGSTSAPGTLGPEIQINLPAEADGVPVTGRLFALVPGDFDNDGNIDLVAGFLDARLAFFHGAGDGTFDVRIRRLATSDGSPARSRSLVAGDFDRDGDLDLAGLDVTGEVWVMQNPGHPAGSEANFFLPGPLSVQRYPRPDQDGFGGRKIISVDYDHDGWPDLIAGSGHGAWLYPGADGGGQIRFEVPTNRLAGISSVVSDLFFQDLDGDGRGDLVISCRDIDCFSVFQKNASGGLTTGLPFDAPASRFIATGDLDGDGQPDLVGSGRVLWTSLSSRPARPSPPLAPVGERTRITNMVINEILASNTSLPVPIDGNHMSEWVEIFNGNPTVPRSLAGWRLQVSQRDSDGIPRTNEFQLPAAGFLGGNERRLIICSERKSSPYHTGFRLSALGGVISLIDPAGQIIDKVPYPPQRANVSYARYRDALRSFVFNPFPSPDLPNPVNGTLEPTVKFAGVDPASFEPGHTIRVFAEAGDDVDVGTLVLHYETFGVTENSPREQVPLFDDGLHGDGEAADGLYGGDLPFVPPVAFGTEIQFFFELTDLNDQIVTAPEDPLFGTPDALGNAYQLAFNTQRPSLEISEVMAWNTLGLRDGTNGRPDWLEIRNIGTTTVPLGGLSLSQQIGDNPRYRFPTGAALEPGGYFLVYCDNAPERGETHAPIALDRNGDTIMLTGVTTNGSRTLIDAVTYGRQEPNVSWARLGAGGYFWKTTPTPTNGNIAPRLENNTEDKAWVGHLRIGEQGLEAVVGIPTYRGVPLSIETAPAVAPESWRVLDYIIGNGIERVYVLPYTNATFLRWR